MAKRLWTGIKRYVSQSDVPLMILALTICLIGLVLIYSGCQSVARVRPRRIMMVQTIGIAAGFVSMILFSFIDFKRFPWLWPVAAVLNILFQLSLYKLGKEVGGNKSWIGQTIIENGTVKYTGGRSFGNEDTTANVIVKGGATLDQNGVRWLLDGPEKPAVRLEEGAVLTSSADIDDKKGGIITKLSLDGDATVHADEHMVSMSKHWNEAYVTIELGTNTLAKTGTNEFYISVCNITGTGTLDVREGMVSVTHSFTAAEKYPGKCLDGTINIHEGAQFRFLNYNGEAANFSVSNLVLNGRVERDGVDLAGAQLDHMLTVTGTLSGSGAARMLTLASGAALKPDGTGAPTIEEEFVLPSGKLTVDLGGIDLGPRRQDIPLILVGDAALLPTAENIEFKNVTVYGKRKDKLPIHWELKSTRTGTGYRLIRGGMTIYLR